MSRRTTWTTTCVALALALGVSACSSSSSDVGDTTRAALRPVPSPTTTTAARATFDPGCDPLASLEPMSPLPEPGDPLPGALQTIVDRGYLVAGIDENTPHLGERNPVTEQLDGLEIELVREIAQALLGDRQAVHFKTVVTKEKNQVVKEEVVDLTASADSMTCERWGDVSFSTEYLETGHMLLVRTKDAITSRDQLAGRRVCVTAGSSSLKLLAEKLPDARPVEVEARNDCLVAMQEGDADAYLGHETFVRGMQEQDPENTTVLEDSLATQHYGIAMSKQRPDLVRFVNGVLQQMREDGRLDQLYARYLPTGRAR